MDVVSFIHFHVPFNHDLLLINLGQEFDVEVDVLHTV